MPDVSHASAAEHLARALAADRGDAPRVRFAPAPSGDLHVGNVRTALYNWLLARRAGGSFVYRIEDTDASRATDEAFHAAQDVLRWLGLDWDEGPAVGGPHAPYRQSERFEIYAGVAAHLQEQGAAYPCFCTPEEVAGRRTGQTPGYDGFCRELTMEQRAAFRAEGREPILRFRMPDGVTTWTDLVRGDVTIEHKDVPDFTLMRSNGHPLYMLAATVDDVLMGMTHILRGEDLVSATPRQLAMYAALGVPRERFPAFGHLPLIVGDDGKPLSKRNGEVSIRWYRDNGFLPSAMLNYLALLGWSLDGEHELFSLAELVEVFSIERVGRNPARFDLKKLEAINGDKIRALPEATLADLAMQQLTAAGVTADADVVARAVPLVQTRLARLTEIPGLLGFLFADPFAVEEAAAEKVLTADAAPVLAAAVAALSGLTEWTTVAIEESLRTALIEGLGLKPKHAFTPVRVAVTGRTVSPPLFESLELLGRDRTLSRLSAAAR